eukprot:GILK01020877.1.p2 GENE.GILK01020877.1~~GILK01020877.1.p2  ORF type:complete len:100 (+),score=1.14 GILK01020877.1:868-1167(+)
MALCPRINITLSAFVPFVSPSSTRATCGEFVMEEVDDDADKPVDEFSDFGAPGSFALSVPPTATVAMAVATVVTEVGTLLGSIDIAGLCVNEIPPIILR